VACGTSEVPTGAADPVGPLRSNVTLVSAPVVVQAMTVGSGGQFQSSPSSYSVCGFGTIDYDYWYWFNTATQEWVQATLSINYEKDCAQVPSGAPAFYNGGAVDVYLVNGSTHVSLGHIAANYSRLTLTDIPVGATLRLVATPNLTPDPGVEFNSWTGANGYSTDNDIYVTVSGGEYFLAELQLPSASNGGGGSGGDPCIICP
jgi:hypothetical protein